MEKLFEGLWQDSVCVVCSRILCVLCPVCVCPVSCVCQKSSFRVFARRLCLCPVLPHFVCLVCPVSCVLCVRQKSSYWRVFARLCMCLLLSYFVCPALSHFVCLVCPVSCIVFARALVGGSLQEGSVCVLCSQILCVLCPVYVCVCPVSFVCVCVLCPVCVSCVLCSSGGSLQEGSVCVLCSRQLESSAFPVKVQRLPAEGFYNRFAHENSQSKTTYDATRGLLQFENSQSEGRKNNL